MARAATSTSQGDVLVRHAARDATRVEINLGRGHRLMLSVRETDRDHQLVILRWLPGAGEPIPLGHTRLDLRERTHEPGWQEPADG